jgi:8-oxo-dGTP pyrophosphatase MutT (NUDIX family)
MNIKQIDYPHLFGEHVWAWGPIKTIFEPGEPPSALVSNVNIAPFDNTGWLIIRQEIGWGIVGGTLEPGETYLETLKRELFEEAGCELVRYDIFGALRMESLVDAPYRPHLPHPISYRLLGVGEVRRVSVPTNPGGAEDVIDVRSFSLEEACRRLEQRPDDGLLLADVYKLAAAFREQTG